MNSNLDKIAQDLYGKIQTRFSDIEIGDENAAVLSKKEDIPKARFFEFEYTEDGEPLGTIAITLDATDGIVVQVSGDLVDDSDDTTHHGAYKFIRSFRQFAKDRLLNFDIQNIGKSNLDKRDYEFQAKRKEEPVMPQAPIMENKMYGNARMSYQDLGEARLVIKHSQPVNLEIPAGRTMHIESIYIENAQGERFKYPFKHLNGARALAEHIKHGGTPYDAIGKHISNLSEELSSLRKFKGFVGRQEQVSEAMGGVTDRVIERIDQIKETIHKLQRPAYYEAFVESFEEHEEQAIPEAIVNNLIDRLTVRTFNEDLKTVFPYIYKFIDESELPVVELGTDDLLSEVEVEEEHIEDIADLGYNESYNPEHEFESFLEGIVSEDKDELFSPNPGSQNNAVEELNMLLAGELVGGDMGVLALKGIIDDPELTSKIAVLDSDAEIRQEIKDYILDNNPDLIPALTNLDVAEPEEIGGAATEVPPAPVEPTPAPAETPEPAPAEAPAPVEPAPVAEGKNDDTPPWDEDPKDKKSKDVTPGKYGQGYSKARHLARQGMADAIKKAQKAGATLETQLDFGDKVMTIGEALAECGLEPEEVGFETEQDGVESVLKYVAGFYNKENHNFPLGATRVKIKVKKAWEDGEFGNVDQADIIKVLQFIDAKDPSSTEQNHVLKLAGVKSQGVDEQQGPDINFNMQDLENKIKGMKLNFGGQEVDLNNPEQVSNVVKTALGGVMQNVQPQVPNQNVQIPGGQINPQDMMKAIMQKLNFGK